MAKQIINENPLKVRDSIITRLRLPNGDTLARAHIEAAPEDEFVSYSEMCEVGEWPLPEEFDDTLSAAEQPSWLHQSESSFEIAGDHDHEPRFVRKIDALIAPPAEHTTITHASVQRAPMGRSRHETKRAVAA